MTTNLSLLIALTGLSAGLGFANAVGYIPTMEGTAVIHPVHFGSMLTITFGNECLSSVIEFYYPLLSASVLMRNERRYGKAGR